MSRSLLSSIETAVRSPHLIEFVEIAEVCGIDPHEAYAQLLTGSWRHEPQLRPDVKGRRINNAFYGIRPEEALEELLTGSWEHKAVKRIGLAVRGLVRPIAWESQA